MHCTPSRLFCCVSCIGAVQTTAAQCTPTHHAVTQQRKNFAPDFGIHGEGRVVVCVKCDDKAAHEAIRAEESDVE